MTRNMSDGIATEIKMTIGYEGVEDILAKASNTSKLPNGRIAGSPLIRLRKQCSDPEIVTYTTRSGIYSNVDSPKNGHDSNEARTPSQSNNLMRVNR